MTLRQSQFVPPVPLIVARELDLLNDIDLETRDATGSPEQLAGLLAGDIDIAITAIDNLFEWNRTGAELRLLAQTEATTPLGVYARAGTGRLAELESGSFGVDASANGFALLARYLLEREGIAVDYVEIGGVRARLDALLAGKVDATLLGPPFDAAAREAGASQLASVSSLLPAFPGQGLVVRADLTGSEELADYLRALRLTVEACASMDAAEGETLLARAGFDTAAASAWASRPRTLDVDPAGLALLTEIRAHLGLLPTAIRLADCHDPEPLRRASGGFVHEA